MSLRDYHSRQRCWPAKVLSLNVALAVMERYRVWKSSGEDIAVCDAQQCCVVFRRNFEEQISDFCGGDRIEISSRFISQQQRRLMNQSATHGNPLPLPA